MASEETNTPPIDLSAPMASAPMQYFEDGTVNWGDMWDDYCLLAAEGGPPHRGTLLEASDSVNEASESYQFAVAEIIRGIKAAARLDASTPEPGWIAVKTPTEGMAYWMEEAIIVENVTARYRNGTIQVPVADHYTLKGEIKNVITAVAKTSHYWVNHVPSEVKQTMALQAKMAGVKGKLKGFFGRK